MINTSDLRAFSFALVLAAVLLSCGEGPPQEATGPVTSKEPVGEETPPVPPPKPAGDRAESDVLARVNDSPITREDVEQAVRSTLGDHRARNLGAAGRERVLESLVTSRAIAQAQEARLTPEQRAALDRKVRAHREKLLVMQYLSQHTPRRPVSPEMVRDYYEKHPERFGAKTSRLYEMLTSKETPGVRERDQLIEALSRASEQSEWRSWANTLQERGVPVAFRKGELSEQLLDPRLLDLMSSVTKGETSRPTFIADRLYVVRIVDEKDIPPRPLSEVSSEIRKTLAPVEVKEAVKRAAEEVLKKAKVIYEG